VSALIDAVRDALTACLVGCGFTLALIYLGPVGDHYGVYEVGPRPPDDRPMVHAVKNTASDVFSAIDVIVEEVKEEL
jgi:hypothetical protein